MIRIRVERLGSLHTFVVCLAAHVLKMLVCREIEQKNGGSMQLRAAARQTDNKI